MSDHKCFISYKNEDAWYKNKISEVISKENLIDKSLKERIDSDNPEYIMRKIREEYLSDSTVTIFLIGEHSSENEGRDDDGYDINYYIEKELQASLYDGKNNTRNGILGVVLPSMEDKIFKGSYTCNICGNNHNSVYINDDTVIREFSYNYYIKPHTGCAWSEDERYCVICTWEQFYDKAKDWVEKAFSKREEDIANKVKVFTFDR